jgi:hypothetical protein
MTDIIERLRAMLACDPECEGRCQDCPNSVAGDAADEIARLREAVAAARREGIEAAAKMCADFRSSVQNELDHASTVQMEAALAAAICGIDKAEAAIHALLEDK